MSKGYSAEIANTLVAYLEKEDYNYDFDQEEGVIKLTLRTDSSFGLLRYRLKIRETDYTSYAYVDMMAKEDHRLEVAEFLTRVNYGMTYGCMELDMRDGEIRCRVTVNAENSTLSDKMINPSLGFPVYIFDTYGDALLKVMVGMSTAEEAIESVENEAEEDAAEESVTANED